MAITERRLTLEEFLKLPEQKPALEYEDGEVTQKVSPKGPHSTLQAVLVELFNRILRPRKLGFAFPELRTTFAGSSRVPDVAIYIWDRIPRDAAAKVAPDFRTPPDIAIEIISPGQSTNRLIRRCQRFLAEGVRVAILVDPVDESLVVFRPNAEPQTLRGTDRLDLNDVISGLELDVQELFQALSLD